MTNALSNSLRKINRSLRTWVDIKIQALVWPIVYREVNTMLEKFELSDEASEEVKNRLLLVDYDEMENKLDDRLADYVEFSQFEEFEQLTNETLGEVQDRLTDLKAESLTQDAVENAIAEQIYNRDLVDSDDVETKIDEKLNERLEHCLVDADYEDINERIDDLKNRVDMIVEKIGSILEKMDKIEWMTNKVYNEHQHLGELLVEAGESIIYAKASEGDFREEGK